MSKGKEAISTEDFCRQVIEFHFSDSFKYLMHRPKTCFPLGKGHLDEDLLASAEQIANANGAAFRYLPTEEDLEVSDSDPYDWYFLCDTDGAMDVFHAVRDAVKQMAGSEHHDR